MIITRTPNRISLFGGGTDYPEYYANSPLGGIVVGMAIDKYSYLSVRYKPPFLGYKTHLSYSEVEKVQSHDDILHNVIRVAIKHVNISDGLCIHHDSDLPSSSGMGSSSTFTVGLLHSLFSLKRQLKSKEELAYDSRYLERYILGDMIGVQDNLFAAHGGFRAFQFYEQGIQNNLVPASQDFFRELESHIILVSSGVYRKSSDIAKTYTPNDNVSNRIRDIAYDGLNYIKQENFDKIGQLVWDGWKEKKKLSDKVCTKEIAAIEETAKLHGAYGFKLLGSGGGGFCLIMAQPEHKETIKEKLSGLICINVKIDWGGTTILHMDNDYANN